MNEYKIYKENYVKIMSADKIKSMFPDKTSANILFAHKNGLMCIGEIVRFNDNHPVTIYDYPEDYLHDICESLDQDTLVIKSYYCDIVVHLNCDEVTFITLSDDKVSEAKCRLDICNGENIQDFVNINGSLYSRNSYDGKFYKMFNDVEEMVKNLYKKGE